MTRAEKIEYIRLIEEREARKPKPLWPAEYADDTPDCQYRFITELCKTWDDEDGQIKPIPKLPHVRFMSDLIWRDTKAGTSTIFLKSRRLVASWIVRACRLWSCGLSKETGVICAENYEKSAEHVWRMAFMYRQMQQDGVPLADCQPRKGNMDAQEIGQLILPNGSLIDTLNQHGNSFQGRGKSWVDMEEASLYDHLAGMWFQAQTVTKGRADVVGGHVCIITNQSPNVEWKDIKTVAKVIENNDPSWKDAN